MKIDKELTIVAKGAGITFSSKTIRTGIKYITQVVLAHILGAELFGLYALGMVVCQLGNVLSSLGLPSGTVRYVSIYQNSRDKSRLKGVLKQAIGLPLLSGFLMGTALFMTSEFLALQIFHQPGLTLVFRIFAVAIPFVASMNVGAWATSGFQTTKYFALILNFFHPAVHLALIGLVGWFGLRLWGASAAWAVASVMGLMLTAYIILNIFPEKSWGKTRSIFETKRLLRFSIPLALGGFLQFILLWMDTLMLGYFRSASEVGIYRAVSQTALLLLIFISSLNSIFSPKIAELFHKEQTEKMGLLHKVVTRWSFSLTLPLFLLICAAGKNILHIFGANFTSGFVPLVILAAGQLINAGTGGVGYMLVMSGHQYFKLASDLALVILNVFLNILLIPKWGLLGAAAATSISIAGVNIARAGLVYFILRTHAYTWNYLKSLGAGFIALLASLWARHWFHSVHFMVSLFILAGSIVFVYFLVLGLLGLEESDRIILNR